MGDSVSILNLDRRIEHRPRTLPSERGSAGRPAWARRYVRMTILMDALAALAAALVSRTVRFGWSSEQLFSEFGGLSYTVVALLVVPLWVGVLALNGAYDSRELGNGSEEYRRVFNAAVRTLAVIAIVAFTAQIALARGFVALLLPLALALTLLSRHALRKHLHRKRAKGEWANKVVVVGSVEDCVDLIEHLNRSPHAGFSVLGACVPGPFNTIGVGDGHVPVLGAPTEVVGAVRAVHADAVAVAGSSTLGRRGLRELGWQLEGTGVDLVVAPAITDIAGPRIVTRPVAGLPLLHVEEPELTGFARFMRDTVDRVLAALLLAAISPLLITVALAVRIADRGPALFKQVRVGRDGREFVIWKFRTMRRDAERELTTLAEQNDHDGVLFKIRNDPRRTRIGTILRRYSIDELPQLWNVVKGDMSIVGPRPPLPNEVARYSDDVRRRLLVKPGLTGLWQVSGRADLAWEEAVRLDLYYVENWSPALDAVILWKTMRAVVSGRGAY